MRTAPGTVSLRRGAMVLVLLLVTAPAAVPAKRIYQYRDAQGILHFTDKKPPDGTEGVKETLVKAEQQRIVEMVTVDGDHGRRFSFVNRLAGPVEVELALGAADNIASDPPAPVRVVLAPQRETPVATVRPADPHLGASYELSYTAVPGDPRAPVDFDFVYAIPFGPDAPFEVHQGFNGAFSHTDVQSRYAVDLSVPEGTPVLAARGGVVMQVERDFAGAGIDKERFASRANLVRVLHDDGSMAVYAHLQLEGVVVTVGQRVRQGQVLGRSGNTGFSTGPHLHFAVQVNTGLELKSVPFVFAGLQIPGS